MFGGDARILDAAICASVSIYASVPFSIGVQPPPAFDVCPLDMLRNGREGDPSFDTGMCGVAA